MRLNVFVLILGLTASAAARKESNLRGVKRELVEPDPAKPKRTGKKPKGSKPKIPKTDRKPAPKVEKPMTVERCSGCIYDLGCYPESGMAVGVTRHPLQCKKHCPFSGDDCKSRFPELPKMKILDADKPDGPQAPPKEAEVGGPEGTRGYENVKVGGESISSSGHDSGYTTEGARGPPEEDKVGGDSVSSSGHGSGGSPEETRGYTGYEKVKVGGDSSSSSGHDNGDSPGAPRAAPEEDEVGSDSISSSGPSGDGSDGLGGDSSSSGGISGADSTPHE